MEGWMWILAGAAVIVSLAGSVFIVAYVWKQKEKRDAKDGVIRPKTAGAGTEQGRKWNRMILLYLMACLVITAVILYQSAQGRPGMEREATDCLAVPVGALFFLIQALACRNTAVKRERATVHTMAVFLEYETRTEMKSGHRSYTSVFEFSADGRTRRVRYPGKYGEEKGVQAELYYAPDDPGVVYIPALERRGNKFVSALILAYGILFPAFALLAPLFR